jgi:hypothetical protein
MEARYQSKLVREVAELVQLLQQEVTNGDVVLDELTEHAVKSVPGARYVGITVRRGTTRRPSTRRKRRRSRGTEPAQDWVSINSNAPLTPPSGDWKLAQVTRSRVARPRRLTASR